LKNIGENAFNGTVLKGIMIPASVAELGESCFTRSGQLREVNFAAGSNLGRIAAKAFDGCPLDSIVLPPGIQFIGAYAIPGKTKISLVRDVEDKGIR
jgi:hypothetical protein